MQFKVTIDQFDGPLDLMLHLIKEKQMDIFSLDIVLLTDQYIDYLHQMEQLHLDIASEYLVELATLIEFKSRKLLPNDNSSVEDNYEEEKEQDLVKRLIEYQKYKEITEQFTQLYKKREMLHEKPQSAITGEWIQVADHYSNTTPYDLIKAMNKVLNRLSLAQPYEVSVRAQRISVEERITQLKKRIRSFKNKVFTLQDSMSDCQDIYDVVVTFLAILQMVNESYLQFSIKAEEVYFTRGASNEQ